MMPVPRGVSSGSRFDRGYMLSSHYPLKILLEEVDVIQTHDLQRGHSIELKFKTSFDLMPSIYWTHFNVATDFAVMEGCTINKVSEHHEGGENYYVAYATATRMCIINSAVRAWEKNQPEIATFDYVGSRNISELEQLLSEHGEELVKLG
jgi:hypothetical protein